MEWLSDKIVVANWKMNGNFKKAESFITQLNNFYESNAAPSCVLCPPYTLLHFFHDNIRSDKIFLGAQHCSPNESGAYTGDISAPMLVDVGCKFVLVAHSERRFFFKETYRVARHQCLQAMKVKMIPILCVGEENKEDFEMTLAEQLDDVAVNNLNGRVIIAYEPVWAIGGSVTPDVEHIIKAVKVIKDIASFAVILYGGSIKSSNAAEILRVCDGLLVGSASLDADEFCNILKVCEEHII